MKKKVLSLIFVFLVLVSYSIFASGNQEKADMEGVEVVDTVVGSASTVETVADTTEKVLVKIEVGTLSEEITNLEVREVIDSYKQNGIELNEEEALTVLTNDILITLALESQGYEITDQIATSLVLSYIEGTFGITIQTQEQLDNIISQYQLDVNAIVSNLAGSYFLNSYLNENYSDILNQEITVTDEEISSVYETNKDVFKNSQKVKISHVFFRLDENLTEDEVKAMADSVYSKISSGSLTYEQAVSDYSEDMDTRANAGILGWVNNTETPFEEELAALTGNMNLASSSYHKRLFTEDTYNRIIDLKAGEVTEPLKSTAGYHIIKAIVRNEEKNLALTDAVYPEISLTVKDYVIYRIEAELSNSYYNQALAQMLTDVSSSAVITKY